MADDNQLLLQIGDQLQSTSGKLDKLTAAVQKLTEEQNQFTHVLAGFFSITTSIEAVTAFALALSAFSLYLTIRWRYEPKTNPPLPQQALLPKPRNLKPKPTITESDVDELLRYAPKTKDKPVDTLAALAQELNGRK